MTETFEILIIYKGIEQAFKARFERWGYSHRIAVLINETTFNFEPDEEGGYRVLVTDANQREEVQLSLLEIISKKLKSLTE
ncbi:hypothetical protein IDJ75_11140 [Mucilaginibacter rigui]|uniref:Uncharacterized protein n=1 Tax=Mucilaginibacter rigui TaxID=534635 RepID=A0ABR7X6X8_9SPHI|nr:hypothetical protein [Mucilaginibacter rigui]MBD1385835.1 hypothetical protein [Mucilaginibacter rigui]